MQDLVTKLSFPPSNLQELPDYLTLEEPEIDEDLTEDNVRKIQIEIPQFQENKFQDQFCPLVRSKRYI